MYFLLPQLFIPIQNCIMAHTSTKLATQILYNEWNTRRNLLEKNEKLGEKEEEKKKWWWWYGRYTERILKCTVNKTRSRWWWNCGMRWDCINLYFNSTTFNTFLLLLILLLAFFKYCCHATLRSSYIYCSWISLCRKKWGI